MYWWQKRKKKRDKEEERGRESRRKREKEKREEESRIDIFYNIYVNLKYTLNYAYLQEHQKYCCIIID